MPSTKRRKAISRTNVSSPTTLHVSSGAGGGDRLMQAAQQIADGIKEVAAAIPSEKIPPSVHVGSGSATTATVYANAPNAYPIETGARHPLWGNRDYWYPMKRVMFMELGAADKLDDAAEVYGETVNDWLREIGW